jgi:cystathionine beta-lyase/cystathionine gamma-synthase
MKDASEFLKSIRPNTSMIWIETPSNPLLEVYDIECISQGAKKVNPEVLIVVDNTIATPYF